MLTVREKWEFGEFNSIFDVLRIPKKLFIKT